MYILLIFCLKFITFSVLIRCCHRVRRGMVYIWDQVAEDVLNTPEVFFFSCLVMWVVSLLPRISSSLNIFARFFRFVLCAPTKIGTTVILNAWLFFSFQYDQHIRFFFCWRKKYPIHQLPLFASISIGWHVLITKSQMSFLFSEIDYSLWIWFVRLNHSHLHCSKWLTLLTNSFLFYTLSVLTEFTYYRIDSLISLFIQFVFCVLSSWSLFNLFL